MKLDCKVTFNSDKVATIEPALATLAGWQGENNAVLVNFIISGLNIAAGIQTKYRVDVVDGAGGVHNGVVMELDNTKAYTSLTVPYHIGREVTLAGGRAELTVVITTFENGLEVNTLMTPPFTVVFGNSRSVGSFGEENNKREINDAVRQAENLLDETKNYAQSVAEDAVRSEKAANNSQECLEEATEQVNLAKAEVENAKGQAKAAATFATEAGLKLDEAFGAVAEAALHGARAFDAAERAEAAKNEANNASESAYNALEKIDEIVSAEVSVYKNCSPEWVVSSGDDATQHRGGYMTLLKGLSLEEGKSYELSYSVGCEFIYEYSTEAPNICLVKKTSSGEYIYVGHVSYGEVANGLYSGQITFSEGVDEGDILYLSVAPQSYVNWDFSKGKINIDWSSNTKEIISYLNSEIQYTKNAISDIETALDNIIAIQENLIGGGTQ